MDHANSGADIEQPLALYAFFDQGVEELLCRATRAMAAPVLEIVLRLAFVKEPLEILVAAKAA
ncbi:MAG: hypothetical protein ABI978_07910 [Chloroflexota bacterium]